MTWKDFINAIRRAKLTNDSSSKILVNLFKAAGTMSEVSESSAKAWINGNRKCKTSTYFPEGNLNNTDGVLRFFKNRPANKLQELQQIFREINDHDSPIDLETDDMDVFCRSLVNQFLDLLSLERLDTADIKPLVDGKNIDGTAAPNGHNIDMPKDIIVDSGSVIPENIKSEKNSQENLTCITNGAQLSIPPDCKICLCCANWKGDILNAYKAVTGTYGKCLLYNRETLSSNREVCEGFEPNYGPILHYQHIKSFKGCTTSHIDSSL